MEIDTSFGNAFLELQNGVNKAKTAADKVLESVGADKFKKVDVPTEAVTPDTSGIGGINVSV